ncbi:MAG: hypothetical protein AB7S26_06130 [Sandaracinaceae bacterium]
MTAKTGIEIKPGISDAQRKTDALMKKLHLEWFGAAIKSLAKGATMTITLDGQRRTEPWAGAHFVECTPGAHELQLEWDTHSIGGHSLEPLVQTITVEPGQITELVYSVQTLVSHGPAAASLEIKGRRPG